MKLKHYLVVLVAVFTMTASPAIGQQAVTIDLSVTGLDDPLLSNVLSSLSLVQQQNSERLTETLVRKYYDTADEEIKQAIQPFGYYSPTIHKDIYQGEEEHVWHVEVDVTPGDPVRIIQLDIHITGQGKDDENLQESLSELLFPLQQGDVLDHQLYEKGKRALSSRIIAYGYRDVTYEKSTVSVNPKQLTAEIELVLETGPQYLFGTTIFTADFLSESLLHRMLPYSEGDRYSPRKIIRLRQALLNSDYFNTIEVTTGNPEPGSMNVPVFISLTPKNPNKYGFGIGYGTDTGARGSFKWTNRRVNQYGHQFNLLLQPSERKSSFGGVYTIPIYDPQKDRLALLGKWEKEFYDTTETELRNVSVAYEHVGNILDYSIYLEYLDEDYNVGDRTGHATLFKPGIRSTLRLTDNRLNTTNGVRFAVNLTGSDENVGSDVSFLQAALYTKGILTFFEKYRFIGGINIGGTVIDDIWDLPPSLRFYAGGDKSVRGYAYKSIGPIDPQGNILGGKYLFTYSLELERQLFGNWSGALFVDGGDAVNSVEDLNMKIGAGVGIRWNAPFGQVRLDIANAISESDNTWRIHFNVGADL